jgi:very-short-patch-repair endonuclease
MSTMQSFRDPDRRIGALATEQHGVVARRQLTELGLTPQHIAYRIDIGRLVRIFRGVYAVGHPRLTREGRWMGAVLTCGPRSVLSHADAAAHWELMPARGVLIDIATPVRSGRRPDRRRIRLHRMAALTSDEVTVHDAIPVTTPARTLLDLASILRPRALEDAIAQADRLTRFDLVAVRRVLDAHPRQHGAPALRGLLDRLARADVAETRSALEVALLQLCDDNALPAPRANVPIAGFIVDFHWPGTDLIVETDGYAYHRMPTTFETDRDRDQVLMLAGYRVARFTYSQLTRQRSKSATRLHDLLTGSGSRNDE